MNRKVRRSLARGFTLVEVMIVIAIILALSALVGLAVLSRQEQAKESMTQVDINRIKDAMRLFRLDFGRYPTDDEGVKVLWDKNSLDPEADVSKWRGYLEEPRPSDRWGNEWGYRQISDRDESQFDLWSFGPNGQDDQGGEDDLTSWPKDEEGDLGGPFMPPGRG